MFHSTRFAQLLKPIRQPFNALVKKHQTDKHSKGFTSWHQLVAMVYAQFNGCRSARQLIDSFNTHHQHLYHLGVKNLHRSTLSDANRHKDPNIYLELCQQLITQANHKLKKELKHFTYLIDSSPIQLLGHGYEWAPRGSRIKGMKFHLQMELSQCLPVNIDLTKANTNDVTFGQTLDIEAQADYIFDTGYYDYGWWYQIHKSKAIFITRPRSNAVYRLHDDFSCEVDKETPILSDERITLDSKSPQIKHTPEINEMPLRKILVQREGKKPMVLFTNDLKRPAQEIAYLYKKRWEIELFFKWIKGNLKIKRFMGHSENAVKIQLLTALIAYLLVKINHLETDKSLSLGRFWTVITSSLFSRPEQEQYYWRRKRERERFEELQFSLW